VLVAPFSEKGMEAPLVSGWRDPIIPPGTSYGAWSST
jgi:hypothetical protein